MIKLVDFTPDQIFEMFALLSYLLSIFVFVLCLIIKRRLAKIIYIIEPLRQLKFESEDEKFLRKTRAEPVKLPELHKQKQIIMETPAVEKDDYSDSKVRLAPIDEDVEDYEGIQEEAEKDVGADKLNTKIDELTDEEIRDYFEAIQASIADLKAAKREQKRVKKVTPIQNIGQTSSTSNNEPAVEIDTSQLDEPVGQDNP